jgi:hypothetical protein
MFYSKYVIDITVPKLRKVLREAVATFDLNSYEDSRGIPRERR